MRLRSGKADESKKCARNEYHETPIWGKSGVAGIIGEGVNGDGAYAEEHRKECLQCASNPTVDAILWMLPWAILSISFLVWLLG